VSQKKTGPLQVILHNFIKSQHLLIIFGWIDLMQFSIDYVNSFESGLGPAAQFP